MISDAATSPIIVGVDGSEQSIEALRYGAKLAAAFGSPLNVVITWDFPVTLDSYYPVNWSPENDAQTILDETIDTAFGDARPEKITTAVLHGAAARSLIEASKDAGMLVLGSRGRGGFVGLMLGSVSSSCAAHAHCPVVIIHHPEEK